MGFPLHPTGQNWVIYPSVGQGQGPPPLQFRGLCQCLNTTEVLLGRNGFGWMTKNGFPDFFELRSPKFWSWSRFCLVQIWITWWTGCSFPKPWYGLYGPLAKTARKVSWQGGFCLRLGPWQETLVKIGKLDHSKENVYLECSWVFTGLTGQHLFLSPGILYVCVQTLYRYRCRYWHRYKSNYRLCYWVMSEEQMDLHLLGKAQEKFSSGPGLGKTQRPQTCESRETEGLRAGSLSPVRSGWAWPHFRDPGSCKRFGTCSHQIYLTVGL